MSNFEKGTDESKVGQVEKEIRQKINEIVRNKQEQSPSMEKYLVRAINFNPENEEILNIAKIQWLKNQKAQVVIDAQGAIKNLGKLADDVGLKGVLRGARGFCSDNIERFGMEEMFDENAIVCDIEDI
jgi:hypothetical protein